MGLFGIKGKIGKLIAETERKNVEAELSNVDVRKLHVSGFYMSRSGDMIGSKQSISIERSNDGRLYIKTMDAPDWRSTPKVREFEISEVVLSELDEIYHRFRIYEWEDLPKGPMMCDAATTSYTFHLGNGGYNSVSFYSDQELPEQGFEAIAQISETVGKYSRK